MGETDKLSLPPSKSEAAIDGASRLVTYENEKMRPNKYDNDDGNDDDDDEELPAPPDGGYGWVICFCSFMCNMIVDGIGYSFGILLREFVIYFGVGRGTVAWVGSLYAGVTLCVGPIVSALVNKFGCRPVCIGGSIIGFFAFILCTFSTSIYILMITYGVIGGFGAGLIYLPAVVVVGYYFERRRSLATGIAVCGSGFGGFAFAPMALFIVGLYDWKICMYVFASLFLCCGIFGFLMRPLKYEDEDRKKQILKSFGDLTQPSQQSMRSTTSTYSRGSQRTVRPLDRKDIFYTSSVINMAQSQHTLSNRQASSHATIGRSKSTVIIGPRSLLTSSFKSALLALLDVSLLKNPVFMLIAISNFFFMAALYVPFVYIVSAAEKNGVDSRNASFVLSIIGITNTCGRVICGYIADFPRVNTLLFNNICLVVSSISVAATPLCTSFECYATIATIFGFSISGSASLTSIILVDLLGLDKLTNAFGLLILFRGIAVIIGSPLAGAVYDGTKSYSIPFLMASAFFAIAAATSFMVPWLIEPMPRDIKSLDSLVYKSRRLR